MDIKSNKEPQTKSKTIYVPVIPNGMVVFGIITVLVTGLMILIWSFVIGDFNTASWSGPSKVGLVLTTLVASGVSTGLYLEAAEEKIRKYRNNDWN